MSAGDRVVTEGSFLLRAESLKLNPTQATSSNTPPTPQPAQPQQTERAKAQQIPVEKEEGSKIQTAKVVLTGEGYRPASVRLRKGIPARLTFVRQVEVTCGTEVVIPDYKIRRELPLNEPVVVEFTPDKSGEKTHN